MIMPCCLQGLPCPSSLFVRLIGSGTVLLRTTVHAFSTICMSWNAHWTWIALSNDGHHHPPALQWLGVPVPCPVVTVYYTKPSQTQAQARPPTKSESEDHGCHWCHGLLNLKSQLSPASGSGSMGRLIIWHYLQLCWTCTVTVSWLWSHHGPLLPGGR